MKNILTILTVFLFIISCNTKTQESVKTKEIKMEITTDSVNSLKHKEIDTESLKESMKSLPTGCLNLPFDSIRKKMQLEKIVDRNTEKWLFGLEKKDSSQFERADLIRPICKLNENNNVLSVVFSDQYDYKTALHVFTFRKSDFEPLSSFILYSIGGDAEDFWTTKYKKSDNWTYEITEIIGRFNDTETKDTTFIELKKTKSIRINESTGKITTEEIKVERNLIITE